MSSDFEKVKKYAENIGLAIDKEIPEDEIIVVSKEGTGIVNLVVDCEDTILVIQQMITKISPEQAPNIALQLMRLNAKMNFGSFVINEENSVVSFRNTLSLKNLDENELEDTVLSLEYAMEENMDLFVSFSQVAAIN